MDPKWEPKLIKNLKKSEKWMSKIDAKNDAEKNQPIIVKGSSRELNGSALGSILGRRGVRGR